MLSKFKLGTKFTVLLLVVFIVGSTLGGIVLSKALQRRAEAQVAAEGLMLMQTISAVREYTNLSITPLLTAAENPEEFIREEVPSFAAKQVFLQLLKTKGSANQGKGHILYKEAVLNPTNPEDQADSFELELIQQFSSNDSTTDLSGFRKLSDKGLVFYSASPLSINSESCLRCHGVPDDAPKAMVEMYGRENGFGWELNSVLGTQVVYVPAAEVFQSARRAFSSIIGIFIGVFLIAILAINWLLNPTVLRPLQYLAKLSRKLGAGDIEEQNNLQASETQQLTQVARRGDELGQLARIFQHMVSEVLAREQSLKSKIQELTIMIDQSRRAREVAEITDNEEFRALQERAKELRKRRQDASEEPS